jgi:hypothetical protein
MVEIRVAVTDARRLDGGRGLRDLHKEWPLIPVGIALIEGAAALVLR